MSDPLAHELLPVIRTSLTLSADESTFRALFEALPDAIVIADRAGRIALLNTQTEQLFGYDRGELLGQSVDLLLPERLRAVHVHHREDYAADPRTRPMGQDIDLVARRKNGEEFPAEISLAPLETPDGLLVISAIRDISERKRADEARAQLEREHAARERAEAEVRHREEFLSIAAHELKTPLTSVKASSQFLARLTNDPAAHASQIERLSDTLTSQVDRLEALVADLLDVSRIQQGQLSMRPDEADLVEIARQVIARFEISPDLTPRHQLILEAPETLHGVWDGPRLDQALTNLISNALKYSPHGGDVRVTLRQDAAGAVIEVSDNGIGIDESDLTNLFKPFARGTTPNRSVSGTGLGLFISQQIVERHRGELSVASATGQGTTFTLRLPLDSRPPAA